MEAHGALPHVVIVGAGFGGLKAAAGLRGVPVHVTVIDRRNHHLFQPLLYQVATAGLSPADIAQPIRAILRRNENTEVLMEEVTGIDVARRRVQLADRDIHYDYLVLATGATHSYFGHPEWEAFAPGLKTIDDATTIRRKILLAFEAAEMEPDAQKRKALMTFVVVGAGPTGVELAGSIAELSHVALASDFRHINPQTARILLIEAGPRILASFAENLAHKARHVLEKLGVEVRTGIKVEEVDAEGVIASGERIPSRTVIWAAGVRASNAAHWLGVDSDRAGRVKVTPELTLPGHPEIFVVGDTATLNDEQGKPLPGTAPVAMQEGKYVARAITNAVAGQTARAAFHYVDKGNLATVGRSFAIAEIRKMQLSGFVAWVTWLFVHIFYLIGFRSRIVVLIEWAWAYVTFQRGARLITKGS